MKTAFLSIATASLLLFSFSAYADKCDAALVPSIEWENVDNNNHLYFLDVINKDNYDEFYRNLRENRKNWSGNAAAENFFQTFFGAKASAQNNEGNTTYEEFDNKKTSEFKIRNFISNKSNSAQKFKSFVNRSHLEQWINCQIINSKYSMNIFELRHDDETADFIVVMRPTSSHDLIVEYSYITGGEVKNAPPSEIFPKGRKMLQADEFRVYRYKDAKGNPLPLSGNIAIKESANMLFRIEQDFAPAPTPRPPEAMTGVFYNLIYDDPGYTEQKYLKLTGMQNDPRILILASWNERTYKADKKTIDVVDPVFMFVKNMGTYDSEVMNRDGNYWLRSTLNDRYILPGKPGEKIMVSSDTQATKQGNIYIVPIRKNETVAHEEEAVLIRGPSEDTYFHVHSSDEITYGPRDGAAAFKIKRSSNN